MVHVGVLSVLYTNEPPLRPRVALGVVVDSIVHTFTHSHLHAARVQSHQHYPHQFPLRALENGQGEAAPWHALVHQLSLVHRDF